MDAGYTGLVNCFMILVFALWSIYDVKYYYVMAQ